MGPTSSKEQIEAYVNEVWPDYLRDLERLVAVPSVVDESASAPGAPWGPGCREALDVAMDIAERQGLIVGDCDRLARVEQKLFRLILANKVFYQLVL